MRTIDGEEGVGLLMRIERVMGSVTAIMGGRGGSWRRRCKVFLTYCDVAPHSPGPLPGLNDFLDTKKQAFPRFYFLSNDELLEILAEAKDPLAVQPFVKKCFEAVKELTFEEEGGAICGMVSVEGEKVTFEDKVDPAISGEREGWGHLSAVEASYLVIRG